jgi:hypothetical protein
MSYFFCGVISCQQQARCLFHNELFFLWGYILSATGKMPVPQRVILFGWIDTTNLTFFQKGGKCGMM